MPTGINSGKSRQKTKESKVIPGARSMHRGINIHQNVDSVKEYKQNTKAKRSDHRDLMVHHQKIADELKDVYRRTNALHKDNMTREERIEQQWKDFERIGGKKPKKVVGYKEHLQTVSDEKKDERDRAGDERTTSGEFVDYSKGSALHAAKDRRIKNFQQRQLKRAHLLRRFGDPTPLKQAGKFDSEHNTLSVFQKTIRAVNREVAHEKKQREVKGGGKGRKSMWDLRGRDDNINATSNKIMKSGDHGMDFGEMRAAKRKRK